MLEKQLYGSVQGMKTVVQRVIVPDHVKRDLPDGTVLPTTLEDSRRFARRTSSLTARLEIIAAWIPDKKTADQAFEVPVNNISRNGACFMHHTQLFPDDEVVLDFGNLRRKFQVTRCRRLGDACFEIGAQVMSS